jgi:phosphoenolpyruvate carboxylase
MCLREILLRPEDMREMGGRAMALPRMPHTGNTMTPLLWKPENWPSRLEELEARTGDLKEAPLRRDVRSLGMLLGDVLREQAGERLFHLEESLRQLSIERREAAAKGDAARAAQLLKQQMDRIAELDLPDAYQLTRAFDYYFELINLAETNHR